MARGDRFGVGGADGGAGGPVAGWWLAMSASLGVSPADRAGIWTGPELVELVRANPALRAVLRDAWSRGWHAGFKDCAGPGGVEITRNPFNSTAVAP